MYLNNRHNVSCCTLINESTDVYTQLLMKSVCVCSQRVMFVSIGWHQFVLNLVVSVNPVIVAEDVCRSPCERDTRSSDSSNPRLSAWVIVSDASRSPLRILCYPHTTHAQEWIYRLFLKSAKERKQVRGAEKYWFVLSDFSPTLKLLFLCKPMTHVNNKTNIACFCSQTTN